MPRISGIYLNNRIPALRSLARLSWSEPNGVYVRPMTVALDGLLSFAQRHFLSSSMGFYAVDVELDSVYGHRRVDLSN